MGTFKQVKQWVHPKTTLEVKITFFNYIKIGNESFNEMYPPI